MSANDIPEMEHDEKPVLSIIQSIKEGRLNPETLEKESRQRCVEVFMMEGYAISQIAQVLKRSEKTIKRDIAEIREQNTLIPDKEFMKKFIGEVLVYARTHRNHLMRLAREQNASVGERAQAEYYAANVMFELIRKLQTLGYLPSAPQSVISDIFHHIDNDSMPKRIIDLCNNIENLKTVCAEGDPAMKELLEFKIQVETSLNTKDEPNDSNKQPTGNE